MKGEGRRERLLGKAKEKRKKVGEGGDGRKCGQDVVSNEDRN